MSQVLQLRRDAQEATQRSLVFSNPGLLDINLVRLLGVSVKDSDDAIGFFGTGLKYAMATALRLGGSMIIITGGTRYEVQNRTVTIRGKDFTQVTLNGDPLGFTTELGKQWEPWMVVRELYSNALDEAGETREFIGDEDALSSPEATAIILRGDVFAKVWDERSKYFLPIREWTPIHAKKHVDAYDALGHNRAVFYRGINIHATQLQTLYRYNIRDAVKLTEDRTLQYGFHFHEALERAIMTSTDEHFITNVLTARDSFHEHYLTFGDSSHMSVELTEEFKTVCANLNARRPNDLNMGAIRFYQKRTQSTQPITPATLTKVQQMQLQKAIGFVKRIGFEEELDLYPIQVVNWLGENVFGKAEKERIYLAKDCFDKGTKFIASTLLEEFVHCHYKLRDESYPLQTWLFDRLVTMGEEYVLREPL